ncbi:ABC transporter ATP-binding protein [Pseudooceanicola sp. CBS1P-1]|uniref:ATP-binding cassette domain-containing protein n=1 Tax=Pseudooceanicola albus TaxID=2692189 RepID=A0A6L7GB99_9RHOB|nr:MULTISPECIES: ABC transporter ATP-binding protein [Pseudooceanicola]MBT9386517.1 ABC transporter ATP-binding protein [Pseudooceanicola endophyticus]MXN20550.1 ATP-binding cassette domain-containing protein [Pseudooceanicola albus]
MIALEGLSKAYPLSGRRQRPILQDVSLTLPDANIAILGRNGQGKSTLLRMIAGIEPPDRGRIRCTGSVSWPIGFRGSFHRQLSGAENVRFVARIYRQNTEYVTAFVRDFAELGPFFDQPVKAYSTGMVGRLAFGLSMAIAFRIYLVDEVLGAGDSHFQHKCRAAFRARADQARLVMVSHSMPMLREFCDAALVIDNGTLTFFPDLEEGIARYEQLNAPSRPQAAAVSRQSQPDLPT